MADPNSDLKITSNTELEVFRKLEEITTQLVVDAKSANQEYSRLEKQLKAIRAAMADFQNGQSRNRGKPAVADLRKSVIAAPAEAEKAATAADSRQGNAGQPFTAHFSPPEPGAAFFGTGLNMPAGAVPPAVLSNLKSEANQQNQLIEQLVAEFIASSNAKNDALLSAIKQVREESVAYVNRVKSDLANV